MSSNVLKKFISPTYDTANRTVSLDIPQENLLSTRSIITVVTLGAAPSAGSVTVHTRALNSTRYFPLKDSSGNAIVIDLSTTDHAMVNGMVSGVKLDMASLAGTGVTGWYFVVSPI